jgi:excisionase family DNA binding protein
LAYRINDAVQISGLGRTTLYKLIGENRLRSVRVGGRRLVLAGSLRELIEGAAKQR